MGNSPMERYRRLIEREQVGGGVSGTLTRRRLVGALGAAAVAGATLPRMVLGSAAAAEWEAPAEASDGTAILGLGVTARAAVGLIGKITQVGVQLTAVGYLTSLRGLKDNQLFTVARGTDFRDPNSDDEGQARFTFHSETEITSLSATGRPGGGSELGTIVANAGGELAIYYRSGGGADFGDPASFKQGNRVAAYSCSFQDNLTLQPPDFLTLASVALGGTLIQTVAKNFSIAGKPSRIGSVGAQRGLAATGWGELTDPQTPRSTLWLAGVLSVVGKDP